MQKSEPQKCDGVLNFFVTLKYVHVNKVKIIYSNAMQHTCVPIKQIKQTESVFMNFKDIVWYWSAP
jgi:hypothetical protein